MTIRMGVCVGLIGMLCGVWAPITNGAAKPEASSAPANLKGVSVGQEQLDTERRLRDVRVKTLRDKAKQKAPKVTLPPQPTPPVARDIPKGGQWVYEVRFSIPTGCDPFLEALKANLNLLDVPGGVKIGDRVKAEEDDGVKLATLAGLLSKGYWLIDEHTLRVRDYKKSWAYCRWGEYPKHTDQSDWSYGNGWLLCGTHDR